MQKGGERKIARMGTMETERRNKKKKSNRVRGDSRMVRERRGKTKKKITKGAAIVRSFVVIHHRQYVQRYRVELISISEKNNALLQNA